MENNINNEILNCSLAHISETNYFHNRGFNAELIYRYHLGYLPNGLKDYSVCLNEDKNVLSCYKYVIPNIDNEGKITYLMFRADNNKMKKELSFEIDSSYATGDFWGKIWNEKTLYDCPKNVFITETWTDALSVIQCNASAISLNRVTNILDLWKKISVIDASNINFILACDADYYGKKTNNNLAEMLKSLGYKYYNFINFPKGIKDCNEWLQKEPDEFKEAVERFLELKGE